MPHTRWQDYGFELQEQALQPLLARPNSHLISLQELREQWQALQDAQSAAAREICSPLLETMGDDDEADWDDDDSDDYDHEDPAGQPVLVLPAGTTIDNALLTGLMDARISTLWVQGDAQWNADYLYGRSIYISGEVHTLRMALNASEPSLHVLGTIHCQYLLEYAAEDDGMTCAPSAYRVSTPYAFLWFVKLQPPLQLPPDCVVFLLGNWEYSQNLSRSSQQPLLIWHECMYALRDDLYGIPAQSWHDAPEWKTDQIAKALAEGQSIWRAGFDPAALAHWRQGLAYAKAKEAHLAWQSQHQALKIAPGFAPAACAMGELMYAQGALAQALPYLQQAHALFPRQQTAMEDPSAYYLALCLLYLGRADEARQVAESEVARASSDDAAQWSRRTLLEIALVQADLETASAQLQQLAQGSLAHNASVLWLHGLWHHHKARQAHEQPPHSARPGLLKRLLGAASQQSPSTTDSAAEHLQQAQQLQAQAQQRNALFALNYDSHPHLRAVVKADTTLDWKPAQTAPADGAALASDKLQLHTRLVASDALNMAHIPAHERSAQLLYSLITHDPAHASQWLPSFSASLLQALQAEQAAMLVRANANVLAHLPPNLITHELCMQAQPWGDDAPVGQRQQFAAQAVPAAVWDEALALRALACGANASDLPTQVVTEAVAQAMVQLHAYDIRYVPAALHTDALWASAVAWSQGCYFVQNHVPSRLALDSQFLRMVVAQRLEAVNCIPGKLFDADLLQHATALYGQHSAWPDTMTRHQLPWIMANDKDHGEHWWRAFWTEAQILQSIPHDNGLRPYEIDHSAYTQAIAEALLRAHGLTWLSDFPECFVSDALYADMLRNEPSSLPTMAWSRRTGALCATALAHGGNDFGAVPAAQVLGCASLLLQGLEHGSAALQADTQALTSACEWLALQPANAEDEPPHVDAPIQHARWLLLRAQGWLIAATQGGEQVLNRSLVLQSAQHDAQWVLSATQRLPAYLRSAALQAADSADGRDAPHHALAQQLQQLHRSASFWLGAALWLQGDDVARAKARQLLLDSGQAQEVDYAHFQPAHGQALADLNLQVFGHAQAMADQAEDAAQCWQYALQAQALLEQSASTDPLLWAYVLDKKRWASLELGWRAQNLQACEDMLQRVGPAQRWAFVAADQAQAAMLGAAHHRLGASLLDEDDAGDTSTDALLLALHHHQRARELFSSDSEAGAGMQGYWDSRLRLLVRLASADTGQAAHWQARLARELRRVRSVREHRRWYWSPEGSALLAS